MFARFVLFCPFFVLATTTVAGAVPADNHDNCAAWAEAGECDNNPNYMLVNCATSCNNAMIESDTEVENIDSFYDLEANDIDGVPVSMRAFEGKVVILTNVASYCGYTESHYRGLVDLWSHFANTEQVEILAFPCNQFGHQEPDTPAQIKQFAAMKGVQFRMMEKINVNGRQAHPLYRYLKYMAGPRQIKWNFATYFVVSVDGTIESYSGLTPMELKPKIDALLNDEL